MSNLVTPIVVRFIVFSGLPGTGKSTIAEALGKKLGVPVFAKDWLEATLVRCEVQASEKLNMGYVGYELLTTLAERQLQLKQSVILDNVASVEPIRQNWRQLAQAYEAKWLVIECIVSDKILHRDRLAVRKRNISGWHELAWQEVERVAGYFAPWQEERLILDATESNAGNLQRAIEFVTK